MPTDPRLSAAHVLIVGSGPLAAAVSAALAAAGVGQVATVRDRPDAAADAGARARADEAIFEPGRSFDLLLDADVLVDASNRRTTRYLANDAAAIRGIALVWGSVTGEVGRMGVAWDERGVDYRDVDPEVPGHPSEETGAEGDGEPAGPTHGVLGEMIAEAVVDVLTADSPRLLGRVAAYDAKTGRVSETVHRREPGARRPGSLEERTAMSDELTTGAISPTDLAAELAGPHPPLLLDVRQDWEAEIVALPGATLIPLHELPDRLNELDAESDLVAYCHHGVRSGRALEILQRAGFTRARHLAGGIDAWVDQVDPSLPRY